jgi:hypothetical protein
MGAQVDGDQLLFAMESNEEPASGIKAKRSEPVLHVLLQRSEGQATLYRLKPPPSGDVHMFRPSRSGGHVVFPTDLDSAHEKITDLVKTTQ